MKKTLVIMGTHPKSRRLFDWNRTDCDILAFNEAANLKNEKGELAYPRLDIVLQLHHEAIWKNPKNRNDEEHYKWITSPKTQIVYMQKTYPEVPKSVKYPIEDVLSLVSNIKLNIEGKQKDFKYLSSSPDLALALVAYMFKQGKKYKRVEIWGIELEMESEYQYQRTGLGFWVGYLSALGIEVVLYNSIFDAPLYGYEGDVAISSQEFESRIVDLKKELGHEKDLYSLEANNFLKSDIPKLLSANVSGEIQSKLADLTKKGEQAGTINGRINESQRYLEKARAMENASGASVFALGEFDGSRITFNQMLFRTRNEAMEINNKIDSVLKNLLTLKKGSKKRQRAINEFGNLVAELMNKNMLISHFAGGMQENQYYVDSLKLSFKVAQKQK